MPNLNNLFIWFIDVGMGDATFVRFPNGTTMLIDFGSTKASQITSEINNFFPTLKTNQFFTQTPFNIDYLFITHSDQDHYNLLKHLISAGYTFGKIFFSGDSKDYSVGGQITEKASGKNWKNFAAWLAEQQKNGTAKILNSKGVKDWQTIGTAKLHVLAADVAGGVSAGMITNTKSIVLMIEYGGQKVILAADATYLTEKEILHQVNDPKGKLQGLNLSGAILKLGHHGSARTSTSKEWVEALKPICLFISAERFGQQTGTGGAASGHRLPQQAAIDTVLQFSPGTLKSTTNYLAPIPGKTKVGSHSYVAYHDDTSSPNNCFSKSREIDNFLTVSGTLLADQTITNAQDISKVSNYYYEVKTDKQIFTTICKLDVPDKTAPAKVGKKRKAASPAPNAPPAKKGAGQANQTKNADLGTTYGLEIKSTGKYRYRIYPWLGAQFEDFSHWGTDTDYHLGEP